MFAKKKEPKLPRVAHIIEKKIFEENRKLPRIEYIVEMYIFEKEKWSKEKNSNPATYTDLNSLIYALRNEKHHPLVLFGN